MTDPLDRHRPALLAWAEARTPEWVRAKLDPADLVQQTLLDAVRGGVPDGDRAALAYLRRALTNNLIDAARKYAPARADVPADPGGSNDPAAWLAAADTSPSERASRNERADRLRAGLAALPEGQRAAVELRYLNGLRVADIARLLDRSEGAVSLLLHRAVTALRVTLADPPEAP